MPPVPGFKERTLDDVAYLIDGQLTVTAEDVLFASGELSAITPDHRHPPGTVVGFDSGTSKWYLATDSLVDVGVAATITSSGHSDGNGVIEVVGNHGTVSVTTATGTGTEAENATDLNADAQFAAHYIATSAGGELTITAQDTSIDEWFYIGAATIATVSFAEGQANEVRCTACEDYRVTTAFAELKDDEAAAQDFLVGALWRGRFRRSALSSLTAAAEEVLLARGSEIR